MSTNTTPTRDECVRAAAEAFAEAQRRRDNLPVAEAARAAWTPGGPPLAVLEQRIAARRGRAVPTVVTA